MYLARRKETSAGGPVAPLNFVRQQFLVLAVVAGKIAPERSSGSEILDFAREAIGCSSGGDWGLRTDIQIYILDSSACRSKEDCHSQAPTVLY